MGKRKRKITYCIRKTNNYYAKKKNNLRTQLFCACDSVKVHSARNNVLLKTESTAILYSTI